jgi:NAD+ kinase
LKFAIFGKKFEQEHTASVAKLIDALVRRGISLTVYREFHSFLVSQIALPSSAEIFDTHADLHQVSFLISIGGDGTLLATAEIIRDTKIPVLGINTGRLGFLSHVDIDQIEESLESLINERFTIDYRTLISVKVGETPLDDFPYALNEVALVNKDRSNMMTVQAYVNDRFMCTYWADGLIVATPTGSTAYSLSCGGPIAMPDSNTILLTPIAPHNLNVRPFVISSSNKVSLRAEGRNSECLLTLDSRSFVIPCGAQVELTRAPFELGLVQLEGHNFFNTIRHKLGWGLDKRN